MQVMQSVFMLLEDTEVLKWREELRKRNYNCECFRGKCRGNAEKIKRHHCNFKIPATAFPFRKPPY